MEQQLTPTSPQSWKNKVQTEGSDLLLPSQNVARVRQMSPQAFLTSGVIPDPLTAIIRRAIHTKKGLNPKDLEKMVDDPDTLVSALKMFDQVLTYVTVEPNISMPPPCDVDMGDDGPCGLYADEDVHKNPTKGGHHAYHEGPRDPNVLYADQVEFSDKVFIFQWCLGGTRDLERFRQDLETSVEPLANRKVGQGKAKRTA